MVCQGRQKTRSAFRSVFGSFRSIIGPKVAPLSSVLQSLLLFRHDLLANAKNTPHSILVHAVPAPPPASDSLPLCPRSPPSVADHPGAPSLPPPPRPVPPAPRRIQETPRTLTLPSERHRHPPQLHKPAHTLHASLWSSVSSVIDEPVEAQ